VKSDLARYRDLLHRELLVQGFLEPEMGKDDKDFHGSGMVLRCKDNYLE